MAEPRQFTREEVARRAAGKLAVFVIDNVVYDVTPFLDEHPGGHEVLLNVAGRDASEDFDDIGHSFDAKQLRDKYAIGEVVPADRLEVKKRTVTWEDAGAREDTGFLASWKFPLVLGLLVTVLYSYLYA